MAFNFILFYRLKELEGQTVTMQVVGRKESCILVRLLDPAGIDLIAPPAACPQKIR